MIYLYCITGLILALFFLLLLYCFYLHLKGLRDPGYFPVKLDKPLRYYPLEINDPYYDRFVIECDPTYGCTIDIFCAKFLISIQFPHNQK